MNWILQALLAGGVGSTAVAQNSPHVHILVPGFEVRELPVDLTNVNNLRFSPEGKLTALGYDGRIWILSDTDGDGLEDRAETFWDRPTLNVPVGMVWSPEGLYVSSHGKVSLLVDDDHDGRADREEVVASGWPATDVASGGVDATGITRDANGDLWFGLICADYSNAYRIQDGVSHYDIQSERGTIQKLSRDAKTKAWTRTTVCTGIRVAYALAFNRAGDLFATDQEGETWLPGGNPLDELDHIVAGKHYGFPPRDARWLPNVIDEPPVVAFGPQHQSTCGLVFNDSNKRQARFGPESWEGDAFVTGFSRGKIWRVRLAKSATGYAGQATLIACSDMLVADAAISPKGAMYVCCHSGPPDWGSGPQGKGKLFKITYVDPHAPQPLALMAVDRQHFEIVFAAPLDDSVLDTTGGSTIEFGDAVRAADRFELQRPGYKSVAAQLAEPRAALKPVARLVSMDGRAMRLETEPIVVAAHHAVMLPGLRRDGQHTGGETVDLECALEGVDVDWNSFSLNSDGGTHTTWPHIDTEIVSAFVRGSPARYGFDPHARARSLVLRTLFAPPVGAYRVELRAPAQISVMTGDAHTVQSRELAFEHILDIELRTDPPVLLTIRLSMPEPRRDLYLHAACRIGDDPTPRPIPPEWLLVPWAPPRSTSRASESSASAPDLSSADIERGRALFTSTKLNCAACHSVQRAGGRSAPDLSNLAQRDAASVLRDIQEPSATIHPDYIASIVTLRDGSIASGVVRVQSSWEIRLVDSSGKEQVFDRPDVESVRPSPLSSMPSGLLDALTSDEVRDLLAFLMTPPAKPPGPPRADPPLPRRRSAVAAVMARSTGAPPPVSSDSPRALSIALVAGAQDHPACEHDYPAWQMRWSGLFERAKSVKVSTATDWPSAEQLATCDVLVFYFWNHAWTNELYRDFDAFLARGGGVVALHSAVIADSEPEKLALRLGLSAQPVRTKYVCGPLDLAIVTAQDSPITRGLTHIDLADEIYWPMIGDPARVNVLATAQCEGEPRPLVWTFQTGKGRVFGCVPGHYDWTFDDALYRILVLRGVAWAAGEPIERFEELAIDGLELRDG